MSDPKPFSKESARDALWTLREMVLRHVSHGPCAASEYAYDLCERAGWDHESYLLAIVFDCKDLIQETS